MTDWVIGVDLGQSQDYSALAVLHRCWWRPGQKPLPETAKLWHEVPKLKKWELGTPYPVITKEIIAIYRDIEARSDWGVKLVVDAGGPGRPVIDAIKAAVRKPQDARISLVAVTITGSGDEPHDKGDGYFTVPRSVLFNELVTQAQWGNVKVADKLPDAAALQREVTGFRPKINRDSGAMNYETMDSNVHDDIVMATAIVLWYSTKQLSTTFPGGRRGATIQPDFNPMAKPEI